MLALTVQRVPRRQQFEEVDGDRDLVSAGRLPPRSVAAPRRLCGRPRHRAAAVPTPRLASAGSRAPRPATIKKGLTVYFIPKDTQNPYEVIADQGGEQALKELGGKVVVSAAAPPTPRPPRSRRSRRPSRPTPTRS